MDKRMENVEDLSEKGEERTIPTIPRNIAISVFAILTISGILVGTLLPDLIEGTENKQQIQFTEDTMDTIIASTIPIMEIGGTTYTNIPIPTLFQVLFTEGDATVDHAKLDTPIGEMMEYLVGNSSNYRLTISPGTGLPMDAVDYSIGTGMGSADGTIVREVPVGLGDDEGSVIFELKLWGVNPE